MQLNSTFRALRNTGSHGITEAYRFIGYHFPRRLSTIVSFRAKIQNRSLTLNINLPTDANTNLLMVFRWLHFLGGITWIGLLYFFNLVNVPFMKELDPATKGKVLPEPDVARAVVVPLGIGAYGADGTGILWEHRRRGRTQRRRIGRCRVWHRSF